MKAFYIFLSIFLCAYSPSVWAQEKTKESSVSNEESHEHDDKAKDEQGHAHAEEKETGEHEDDGHGEKSEHKEHGGEEKKERSEAGEEHDEGKEEEEFSSSVGPGNAVMAADDHQGIQLSEKAQATLEIRLQPVSATLPKSAIVAFKDKTGVYRFRNGWFKLIEGRFSNAGNQRVAFNPKSAKDFMKGDQVVVNGTPLLRVVELDAFAGESAGHGH